MKATGIVRRIDDLGRIVIPKEVRRTLRIREGDPMEIFVDCEGVVILKKYSPIRELGDFAKEYAESLFDTTGHIVLIADDDRFIAVSGTAKKFFLGKPVGIAVENALEHTSTMLIEEVDEQNEFHQIVKNDAGLALNIKSLVIAPIICQGDKLGAVILASGTTKMAELEIKLVETTASFLAKHLES